MIPNDLPDSPALLAEGFANHVVAWSREYSEQTGHSVSQTMLRILQRAAFMTSMATSDGHVCALLEDVFEDIEHPVAEARTMLLGSGAIGTPEEPGARPLILDSAGRLYLHRYFDYECRLARRLLATDVELPTVHDAVKCELQKLFAPNAVSLGKRADWQKIAAALALQNPVTIISGGPGTGKTTTVVNILACLLTQDPKCRIALAAPTGKAAARMLEAIRSRAGHLPEHLQSGLPNESYTVHRLLGVTPMQGVFRHDAANLLPVDVLIVDEASMLDLALAVKLFEAVPTTSRILLLGDKDQLAAVESGAVFSELCADPTLTHDRIAHLAQLCDTPAERICPAAPVKPTRFRNSVVWFSENFRFSKDSGIGMLAARIGTGDALSTMDWLRQQDQGEVTWINDGNEQLAASTVAAILDGYADYIAAVSDPQNVPQKVFDAFARFRVLCAVRSTARGVAHVNDLIASRIRPLLAEHSHGSDWYVGRPVMVTRNDYTLKLFNGDIGIALLDEGGRLMVHFPALEGEFRAVAPARLPDHETAFAMTIHKAQGSEFDQVLIALPEKANRILTRELFYTGITRARKQVSIAGSRTVIEHAITCPTKRHSGLLDRMSAVGC